jgi:hypothetical protein
LATAALSQSSSALRPAAVILMRPASIALPSALPVVLYCCEPGVHKVSQRAACEAMREHNCIGGAERNAGEQSQRPPLFRAHMTFSRRRCHHLVVAKVASRAAARATAQLLLRFAAPARARFNALT